jgi:hypothetical protein
MWTARALCLLLLALGVATGCRVNGKGFGSVETTTGDDDAAADPPEVDAGVSLSSPDAPAVAVDAPTVGPAVDAPAASVAPGGACSADGQCGAGVCVAGACCESRCDSPCMACSAAGRCLPRAKDTACGGSASCGGSTLTAAPACDGAGTCVARAGKDCPGSLKCADATTCLGHCTRDVDCTGTLICDGGLCARPGKALGADCRTDGASSECRSGFCADGVCCESACTGACLACIGSVTGSTDGKCANVEAGRHDPGCTREDPSTCGEDGTCDGNGRCSRYPDGTVCGGRCCTTNRGQGSGSGPCNFRCVGGTCDRNNPVMTNDRCGLGTCCCPGAPDEVATCRPFLQCDSCQ